MSTLIIKLNATGDVVRTTALLHRLDRDVTWITAAPNIEFLSGRPNQVRCLAWASREAALDRRYDLLINLEDDAETAAFANRAGYARLFGAYAKQNGSLTYSDDSRGWFDLSLISAYGRRRADELKLQNRKSYQELIFDGLGLSFAAEQYVLPQPATTDLAGDVAIAPVAGAVWPMKAWAYYDELKSELEAVGLVVNMLPYRPSLLEHLGDIANHRCLVSGDSLPMHLALGTRTQCVTLFNCTSPWEIFDYGIQTKIVSPHLEQFFYKRDFNPTATTAIRLDEVFDAVINRLRSAAVAVSNTIVN